MGHIAIDWILPAQQELDNLNKKKRQHCGVCSHYQQNYTMVGHDIISNSQPVICMHETYAAGSGFE